MQQRSPAAHAAVIEAVALWNAVRPVFVVRETAAVQVRWGAPGEVPATQAAWTTKRVKDGVILSAETLLNPTVCWAV